MHVKHLGDALDFWKGGFFKLLGNALNNFHVLPMFTDVNASDVWMGNCMHAYVTLLGVHKERILRSADQFKKEDAGRIEYFEEINLDCDADLFVDPDTGIEPPGGGDHRHIRVKGINVLLPNDSKRVLLIYQHRTHESDWVENCLKKVSNHENLKAFAYDAGGAAMIFVARRENQRLNAMRKYLHDNITHLFSEEVDRLTDIYPTVPSGP